MCKCKNGTTDVDYLTLVPGGTAADAVYQLAMTHYTCGGRKLCANGYFQPVANLNYQVQGTPQSLGNGTYCCDVLVYGTVTYQPYKCGDSRCQCNQCPVTDNIYTTVCVPCPSAATPTITPGNVVATPTDVTDCCPTTNAIGITTSFQVTEATTTATTEQNNGD